MKIIGISRPRTAPLPASGVLHVSASMYDLQLAGLFAYVEVYFMGLDEEINVKNITLAEATIMSNQVYASPLPVGHAVTLANNSQSFPLVVTSMDDSTTAYIGTIAYRAYGSLPTLLPWVLFGYNQGEFTFLDFATEAELDTYAGEHEFDFWWTKFKRV